MDTSSTGTGKGKAIARRGKGGSKSQATEPTDAKATGIQLYQPQHLHDNRPVGPDDFTISEIVSISGDRPIGSSAMQVSEMFSMSGARPIGMSTLHIDEVYSTMGGNRPIASNEIDDSSALMGFLD